MILSRKANVTICVVQEDIVSGLEDTIAVVIRTKTSHLPLVVVFYVVVPVSD